MPETYVLDLYSGFFKAKIEGSLPLVVVRGAFTPKPVTLAFQGSNYFCTGVMSFKIKFANVNFFNKKYVGITDHYLVFYK